MIPASETEYLETQRAARAVEARIVRITAGAVLAIAGFFFLDWHGDLWITAMGVALAFSAGLWFVIHLCETRNRLVGYARLLSQEQTDEDPGQPLHLYEACAAKLHWLPMTAKGLRDQGTSLGAQYGGVPVEGYESAAAFIDRYVDPFGEYLYDRLEDNRTLAIELRKQKQLRGKNRRAKFRQDLRVGVKYAFTNAIARNWSMPILATRVFLVGALLPLSFAVYDAWYGKDYGRIRWWLQFGLPILLPTLGFLTTALHGLHRVMFGRGTALSYFWRFLPARWEYLKLLGIRARYVDARAMTGTSND